MAERTEQDNLVIVLLVLFVYYCTNAVEFWIILGQQICKFQDMMRERHQCGSRFCIKIIVVHIHIGILNHLVEAPSDQITNMRGEPENAARCLPPNSAHHEWDAAHIMKFGKRLVLKPKKLIVQVILLRGKAGFNRIRPTHAEILNVFSASTVQHRIEAM